MKNLRTLLAEAEKKKVAIGHFNFSNIEGLWAIFNAARELKLPIIVGVSEGERNFVGLKQVAALVNSIREEYSYPIFLNADHTFSVKGVKRAIDAGFDAVIFDGAGLTLAENIAKTKECVKYAKASRRTVLVEGELGYIGTSSKMLDKIPAGVGIKENDLTKLAEAVRFVKETGVDLFSPSVGNLHGMLKHAKNPRLNIQRIKEIKQAVNKPLVLHGGSGIIARDFKAAIKAGINIIHINTEIRIAYRESLTKALKANPDEVTPYKIMEPVRAAMEKVVRQRLKLFNSK